MKTFTIQNLVLSLVNFFRGFFEVEKELYLDPVKKVYHGIINFFKNMRKSFVDKFDNFLRFMYKKRNLLYWWNDEEFTFELVRNSTSGIHIRMDNKDTKGNYPLDHIWKGIAHVSLNRYSKNELQPLIEYLSHFVINSLPPDGQKLIEEIFSYRDNGYKPTTNDYYY